MSTKMMSWAALNIPKDLKEEYGFRPSKKIAINGDLSEAGRVAHVSENLSRITRFMDHQPFLASSGIYLLGMGLQKNWSVERSIKKQHPSELADGYGLGIKDTPYPPDEALFVGPKRHKISYEGAIWIGQALAAPHIERVYYLGEGIDHIAGLEQNEKIMKIGHYLDCIRVVEKSGEVEMGYMEMLDMHSIKPEEAIL